MNFPATNPSSVALIKMMLGSDPPGELDVAEELDNPVHPAEEPEHAAVREGQEAWGRLQASSTWEDWKAVGAAHVIGRTTAMRDGHINKPKGRSYNAAFRAWQKKFGFEGLDSGDRSRLFDVVDHLGDIEVWRKTLTPADRVRLNHPASIWRRWKAATAVPDPNAPPKASPVQKLKDSLITLQEENDRMKCEIERGGGDLWSRNDRPQDIARVIVAGLSKNKAEKVAREILRHIKS